MNKFLKSFGYATKGLSTAMNGRNFKIQLISAIAVISLSTFLKISRIEFAVVFLTIGFVLATEMLNTAIEEICNKFHPETHPHIALIKDVAAGAVLLSSIIALIVGMIIFVPRIF